MISPDSKYYVPHSSYWPIVGSIGLFLMGLGAAHLLHAKSWGPYLFMAGSILLVTMMFGWFGTVIKESRQGLYSEQMDRSFRWGMFWFIFSEVMFFGVFFGALFYAREISLPSLGGLTSGDMTHQILWPNFQAAWPLYINPDQEEFKGPMKVIGAMGIPALNTLLLLSSAVTVTWAHWCLKKNKREMLVVGMMLTIVLGVTFLGFQIYEYILAHHHYGLTFSSGIYGTTFFMLTGFHGAHVLVGAIMLTVMLVRIVKGHFTPEHHFAFEASAWYWHFVDVVWLFLFVFVYWL